MSASVKPNPDGPLTTSTVVSVRLSACTRCGGGGSLDDEDGGRRDSSGVGPHDRLSISALLSPPPSHLFYSAIQPVDRSEWNRCGRTFHVHPRVTFNVFLHALMTVNIAGPITRQQEIELPAELRHSENAAR